ncbi:hypothetical protein AYI69_g6914 [Smittium culicis]|uniref:Uncharacterized protein n=1 Tax=Smittium culicis TaxID=133412 RepID=A0A1R1XVM1_9FUNG|nr:hypothetical protein AYI69_g6914 [Smittium culicis]
MMCSNYNSMDSLNLPIDPRLNSDKLQKIPFSSLSKKYPDFQRNPGSFFIPTNSYFYQKKTEFFKSAIKNSNLVNNDYFMNNDYSNSCSFWFNGNYTYNSLYERTPGVNEFLKYDTMIKPKPLGGLLSSDFVLNYTLDFFKYQNYPWALISTPPNVLDIGTKPQISNLNSSDINQYFLAKSLIESGIVSDTASSSLEKFIGTGFLGSIESDIYLDIPLNTPNNISRIVSGLNKFENADSPLRIGLRSSLNDTSVSLTPFYASFNSSSITGGKYNQADKLLEEISEIIAKSISGLNFLNYPEFKSILGLSNELDFLKMISRDSSLVSEFLSSSNNNTQLFRQKSARLIQNLHEYKSILKNIPMGAIFIEKFNSKDRDWEFQFQFGSASNKIPNIGFMPTDMENIAIQLSKLTSALLNSSLNNNASPSSSKRTSAQIVHGLKVMPQFQYMNQKSIPSASSPNSDIYMYLVSFMLSAYIPIYAYKFVMLKAYKISNSSNRTIFNKYAFLYASNIVVATLFILSAYASSHIYGYFIFSNPGVWTYLIPLLIWVLIVPSLSIFISIFFKSPQGALITSSVLIVISTLTQSYVLHEWESIGNNALMINPIFTINRIIYSINDSPYYSAQEIGVKNVNNSIFSDENIELKYLVGLIIFFLVASSINILAIFVFNPSQGFNRKLKQRFLRIFGNAKNKITPKKTMSDFSLGSVDIEPSNVFRGNILTPVRTEFKNGIASSNNKVSTNVGKYQMDEIQFGKTNVSENYQKRIEKIIQNALTAYDSNDSNDDIIMKDVEKYMQSDKGDENKFRIEKQDVSSAYLTRKEQLAIINEEYSKSECIILNSVLLKKSKLSLLNLKQEHYQNTTEKKYTLDNVSMIINKGSVFGMFSEFEGAESDAIASLLLSNPPDIIDSGSVNLFDQYSKTNSSPDRNTKYDSHNENGLIISSYNSLNPLTIENKGFSSPVYTVFEYIYEKLNRLKKLPRFEINQRSTASVKSIMDEFNIANLKNTKICDLSPGEQKAVGLSTAFIGNPDLVILKDPMVSLFLFIHLFKK